ncbi:hypothetical protein L2719_19475 [Shewanella schlegeliana]|uniref:Flagellar hook-length control protein FliK n=1 Tax=Shewanella schlegeliana TaxID=190308 RepID=A0ABS1SSU6_9GAMM|nr:hypothetical protein [Shewanella schlegeliana]MBL4911611.1 hypothetical protein [Shewanella schlegeliana]MCL1111705.1 hypothetical protein [Shewanella schlegeliana]GIU38667.1 hypothetical protein TUM4433_40580 [Shewanella schlegeliana]
MDPLTSQHIINTPLKETGFSSGKSAHAFVPVSVTVTSSGVKLSLSGKQYGVKSATPLPLTHLLKAQRFLLNIVQVNSIISQSSLIALGPSHNQALPQALLSVIGRHPNQEKKLQQLAKRREGYPLPNAKIEANQILFDKTPAIKLEQSNTLVKGTYAACIKTQGDELQLCLSPIQFNAQISLTDLDTGAVALQATETPQSEGKQSSPLIDINTEYQTFLKRLGAISTAHILKDNELPKESQHTNAPVESTEIVPDMNKRFLAGALRKAGGLPTTSSAREAVEQNLATALQRILPNLIPEPLADLTHPQRLKQAIETMLQLSASSSIEIPSAASSHTEIIHLLFLLLLGRKNSQTVSPELANKLKNLQQQLGLPDPLMKLLEASASQSSIGKLISNLNLYQQACSKNEQTTEYYFALPYSINHYQEQLEGQIQKQPSNDGQKSICWNLKLKFNLASGAVLVTAKMLQHAKSQHMYPQTDTLSLRFSSNNESLLNKIKLLQHSLSQKIEAIGFSTVSINTELKSVPASLLPGEHYLVKVEV